MLVPSDIRKSVCFIYVSANGSRQAVGTAFFVSEPWTETSDGITKFPGQYLITAMHIIAESEKVSDDGLTYLRINNSDGGFQFVEVKITDWKKADQSERVIDVAVLDWQRFAADKMILHELEWASVKTSNFATADVIESEGVDVGCDIILPGLFVNHIGSKRNIPIVRGGTIASMPEEPVSSKLGPMHCYFVESRSVGGLSGSPVFAALSPYRANDQGLTLRENGLVWCLIGLMHGHWDAPLESSIATNTISKEKVNLGIAMVVPADDIMTTIYSK